MSRKNFDAVKRGARRLIKAAACVIAKGILSKHFTKLAKSPSLPTSPTSFFRRSVTAVWMSIGLTSRTSRGLPVIPIATSRLRDVIKTVPCADRGRQLNNDRCCPGVVEVPWRSVRLLGPQMTSTSSALSTISTHGPFPSSDSQFRTSTGMSAFGSFALGSWIR